MKKLFFRLLILSIALSGCSREPINLSDAKSKVKEYYESGQYDSEVNTIISGAIERLSKEELNENSAVIFDVDETALSNYEYAKNLGYGYTWKTWDDWVKSEQAKAVPAVKKLYDFLISKNVKVIFLTGRTAEQCKATLLNLKKEGYTKFDTLICRSEKEAKLKTEIYKRKELKKLAAKSYKIIACVGDQPADVSSPLCKIKILIPNYLYKLD